MNLEGYVVYSSGYLPRLSSYGTVEIVSSVLHTLSPNDPGSLWQTIVSSPAMNKVLELDDLPQTAKGYRQALTEAYNQAHGWDTIEKADSVYHVRCCQLQGCLRLHTWSDKISFYFGQPKSPAVWTRCSSNAPALAKNKG